MIFLCPLHVRQHRRESSHECGEPALIAGQGLAPTASPKRPTTIRQERLISRANFDLLQPARRADDYSDETHRNYDQSARMRRRSCVCSRLQALEQHRESISSCTRVCAARCSLSCSSRTDPCDLNAGDTPVSPCTTQGALPCAPETSLLILHSRPRTTNPWRLTRPFQSTRKGSRHTCTPI